MRWLLLIFGLGAAWFAGQAVLNRRSRRKAYSAALDAWRRAPGSERGPAMRALLGQRPINGPASYLLACTLLREGRLREAAREFGAAYHADCNLESAALLTFACLKSKDGPGSDIVQHFVQTWREMKRPELNANWEDRAVLSTLAEPGEAAPTTSSLGTFVCIILGPAHPLRQTAQSIDERESSGENKENLCSTGVGT